MVEYKQGLPNPGICNNGGLFGPIGNWTIVLDWELSDMVGYRSFPMNGPTAVATNTARMGRYFNMFFVSFEIRIL